MLEQNGLVKRMRAFTDTALLARALASERTS